MSRCDSVNAPGFSVGHSMFWMDYDHFWLDYIHTWTKKRAFVSWWTGIYWHWYLTFYCMQIRHLPLIRGAKMNQGAKYQWWNLHEMLRSRSCWEAHNLLKSMFCCEMFIFWRKWWNLDAEKQVMLRSTKSAEKHVLLWNVYFLTEMVKLKCWEAGHAEKHKTCWKACFVVKCLFFWWKK